MNNNTISNRSIDVLKKRRQHLQELAGAYKFRIGWFSLSLIGASFAAYSIGSFIKEGSSIEDKMAYAAFGFFIGAALYGYTLTAFKFSVRSKLRYIEYELVQLGAEELQENIEENFFTKLVKINFKYIDQYYLQTQEQAAKSFRLASFASVVGLLIVCLGIFMMFLGKQNPAYVTTAAGIISEFIAAIFFYLYNRTVLKMSQYHQKLVITQNISLALKMSEDMDSENKFKVQEMIIDRLTFDINKYLSDKEQ